MTQHKFAVGDRVKLVPDRLNQNVRPGLYTIVRTMPVTSTVCLYRAKSALDAHERVLEDSNSAQLDDTSLTVPA